MRSEQITWRFPEELALPRGPCLPIPAQGLATWASEIPAQVAVTTCSLPNCIPFRVYRSPRDCNHESARTLGIGYSLTHSDTLEHGTVA